MRTHPNAERDRDIIRQIVHEQATLQAVGDQYGLTRERVRQIVLRLRPDFDVREQRSEVRRDIRKRRDETRVEQQREAREEGRTSTLELDWDSREKIWTDEEMLLCLREIESERGGHVGLPTWTKISHGEGVPSASLYVTRFGSWNGARHAAGLPTISLRRNYVRKFSDEQIIAAVAEFLRTAEPIRGTRFGASHYEQWRKIDPDHRPSLSLIRIRMGGWSATKRAAITYNEEHFNG